MSDSYPEDSLAANAEPADTIPNPLAARLPPTVLTQIFELLHDNCEREGSLEWLAATHVCQHWRTHALGNPTLWASLNPMILVRGLLDDFLYRSEKASLDIVVGILPDHDNSALRQAYRQVVTDQLHRIRTLVYPHIEGEHQFVPAAEEIALLLKEPAPFLRTLRLPGLKRSRLLFREAGVLLSFLTNHAPALQELELYRFPPNCFPWGSPPSGVRTLVLCADSSIEGALLVTFTQLLDGLRGMPGLQVLSLSGVVPRYTTSATMLEPVHLPHLQKLRLTGSGEQYALLWHALKIHPECAAQIEIIRSNTFPAILPAALEKHFTDCDISSLNELHVKRNAATGLAYDIFPLGHPPDEWAPPSCSYTHPYLSLFVAWETKMKSAPHTPAVQMFAVTPLFNVKRLTIDAVDATRNEPERMARLDQRVAAVEDLTLRAFRPSQLSSMFLLLGGTLLPLGSDEGDEFCMPRLRTMTLKQCRFDHDVAEPALRDTLERRVRCGVPPLEVLSFVGCGVDADRVEELEDDFLQPGLIERILSDEDAGPMSPISL